MVEPTIRAWLAVLIIVCPSAIAKEGVRCNATHCVVSIDTLNQILTDAGRASDYARLCRWVK